jgi:hypothetical protein
MYGDEHSLSSFLSCVAVKESRPEVGSSIKRTLGLVMSSQAMLSRFFSPPLSLFVAPSPTIVS